jgi:hypothetical protein
MLTQVRELNLIIEKARGNLASLGKLTMPAGMAAATAETRNLAKSWSDVAKNATMAQRAMGTAASTAIRSGPAAATGGGGGGRHRPSWLGGHVSGPGAPLPGGGHIRFGGAGMAAAGVAGWGIYQAAETGDLAWQLTRHAGLPQTEENHARFRAIIQSSQIRDGFDLKAVGEAALQDIRMMSGTPGGGIDSLPEMLHIAAVEARSKGTGLGESMTANVGLAHMLKAYGEEAMLKLAPTIAAISTADPRSLTAMERGAGYVLPTMQAIGADPMTALLLSTGLARAGVLSSKSGTWLREAVTRSMPGTSLMSKMAFRRHEEALKAFDLVDDRHQPAWFTDGKPDLLKLHEIAGNALQRMPIAQRAGNLRAAFGAQGAGDIGVMADPVVLEQIRQIRRNSQSPEFQDSYHSFSGEYQAGSVMQSARTAMQEFNVVSGELARQTLPSLNIVLSNFRSILEGIRGILPGGDGKGGATVGARAIEGAAAGLVTGAAVGAFGGPVGMMGGAIIGGAVGGVEGVAEQYMRNQKIGQENPGETAAKFAAIRGAPDGPGRLFADPHSRLPALPPLSISLNIDGRTLAQAVSSSLATLHDFPGGAPAADGMTHFNSGDHNQADN